MKQSSKRLFSLIVAVLFLFSAFFIYFNAIQPAYEKVQAARSQVYAKEDFIDTQKTVVEEVKLALAQYEGKEEMQNAVSMAIPPGTNQSEIAHQISSLATQNQLTIQSMTAATPTVQNIREVQSGAAEIEDENNFKVKPLGVLSFQIRVSGTYNNFKDFVSGLETNIRIVDVKNVGIEQLGRPNQDFYLFNLTVATYYQNP